MLIRKAEEKDLQQLTDIYNYEIQNGTATFDTTTKSTSERKVWFDEHNIKNHPLIVAEIDGVVLGYASLSTFNPKEAYAQSVELSVYIDKESRGMHIGAQLMKEIINIAKNDPITKTIVSIITSDNEKSILMHKKFGFSFCGRISNVAVKFDKSLSIDYYVLNV